MENNTNTNVGVMFGEEARQKMLIGATILNDVVKSTLGPRGRNVVIEQPNGIPLITKDGVTCAKIIKLRDKYENLGAQIIKQAAARTGEIAGDGTTTATVLAHAMLSEGLKLLGNHYAASELKRGIEKGVELVVSELQKQAFPISDKDFEAMVQVGTISANGEKQIGNLIAQAISKVGIDGVVTIEDARGLNSSLEVSEGMRLDKGLINAYLVTDQQKGIAEFKEPYVFIMEGILENQDQIVSIMTAVADENRKQKQSRGLVIFAEDVTGAAMKILMLNHAQGTLFSTAVQLRGEIIRDVAAMTGAETFFSDNSSSFQNFKIAQLGTCDKLTASRQKTIILASLSNQDKINTRIEEVRKALSDTTLVPEQKEFLQKRLARLSSGAAILHVGGKTDIELRERKDRVDDALNATLAAVEEGVVPGGGVALVRCRKVLREYVTACQNTENRSYLAGIGIVLNACKSPLSQIIQNGEGEEKEQAILISNELENGNHPTTYGYDASNNVFGDMFQMGIIDPVKVTRSAIQNAASAVGVMLMINAAVVVEDSQQALFDKVLGGEK